MSVAEVPCRVCMRAPVFAANVSSLMRRCGMRAFLVPTRARARISVNEARAHEQVYMDEMYRVVAINSFFFEELPAGSEGEASVIHFGPYSPLPDSSRKDLKEHDR
jgi:hypothetical protein